jgi:hypothetical protein
LSISNFPHLQNSLHCIKKLHNMQTLPSLHKFFPQCEFLHLLVPQLESGSEKELINPFQIVLFFPLAMPQWNVSKPLALSSSLAHSLFTKLIIPQGAKDFHLQFILDLQISSVHLLHILTGGLFFLERIYLALSLSPPEVAVCCEYVHHLSNALPQDS